MRAIKILLIVVVLLVIGLWVVTPRFGHSKHPKLDFARCSIQTIRLALDTYRDGHGSYPSEEQGLSVLPSDLLIQGMSPQYRPKGTTNSIIDPWGMPYRYRVISGKPSIRSAGPDARFDTKDDIMN
jgi:type II secretory pathway pseudopilin PulG